MIVEHLYGGRAKPKTGDSGGGGSSESGGSDTFESQLILDNVVNSGTKKTENAVVNETVAVLKEVLGDK